MSERESVSESEGESEGESESESESESEKKKRTDCKRLLKYAVEFWVTCKALQSFRDHQNLGATILRVCLQSPKGNT